MTDHTPDLAAVLASMRELQCRLGKLEDLNSVRSLQFKYGYYMDKGLYQEVVDLFAKKGAVHFMGGIFRGRSGLERLYLQRFRQTFTSGINGPVYGLLLDHMQLQDIVDVNSEGTRAKGRFRALLQGGSHDSKKDINPRLPRQWWEAGVYENEYVKEDGVWKIEVLNYNLSWQADFDKGWAHSSPYNGRFFDKTFPDDPAGPDELTAAAPAFWPHTPIVPFHYPHPVTGNSHGSAELPTGN
jgi:SnoaL-like domain